MRAFAVVAVARLGRNSVAPGLRLFEFTLGLFRKLTQEDTILELLF